MRRIQFASAALLLAAAFALTVRGAGQANPSSSNDHVLRIGVVRVGQIFHTMQEVRNFKPEFDSRRSQVQQDLQKRTEELNQLASQREQLKPGSAQWNDLRDTIDKKTVEAEIAKQMGQLQLDRFRKANLKSAYDHIAQAAAMVAQQQHLDLVIADSSPDFVGPDLDAIPTAQLDQVLSARAILFANKKADITEDVQTTVDANFARRNPGLSIAPSGNPGGTQAGTNNK